MTARRKTRPRVPGVTDATTRAAWKPIARASHGQLVRSLRPSLKHLIVPLDVELPRGPHQRLRTRRRLISKATRSSMTSFGRSALSSRVWYRRRVAFHASGRCSTRSPS
jgi:hypothetical protein